MQAALKPVTHLSIARHALQFILHSAVEASPNRCCGMIGLRNTLICKAAALPNNASDSLHHCEIAVHSDVKTSQSCDLQHTAAKWKADGIVMFGSYFTATDEETPKVSELRQFETALKSALPELSSRPITHLALMLNTAGCLEAFAYQIHQGSVVPVTLILEEDGQQQKNG